MYREEKNPNECESCKYCNGSSFRVTNTTRPKNRSVSLIAFLVSKSELVTEVEYDKLMQRLKQLNPRAPKKKVHFGQTEIADILDIRGFSLESIPEIEPDFLQDVSHEHDDDVSSFVYRDKKPFDFEKLEAFFRLLIENYGADMLRYKGILNIKGAPTRVIFQGVHMLLASEPGKRWAKKEQRENVMVFIGRNFPRHIFEKGLALCHAE